MVFLWGSVLLYEWISSIFIAYSTPKNTCCRSNHHSPVLTPGISGISPKPGDGHPAYRKKNRKDTSRVTLLLIALLVASVILIPYARAVNPPDADFNPDCGGNQGTGGTTLVTFADNSTGVVESYEWDFGDGTTSSEKNPLKTYSADGNYTVKHVARNSAGWDSIIKGYSTACPHPLIVDFYAVPQYGAPQLTVQFTDNTDSVDPATNTYFWEFGDGGTSDQLNPVHVYAIEGTFTVNLTVTEKNHHYATLSKPHYIHVGAGDLNAEFSGDPRCGHSPLDVQFTDASTADHNQWEWNFGDGGMSYIEDPLHTYNEEGSYTVSLYISNSAGGLHGWIIKTDFIRVIPEGVASFTASPPSGTSPLTVEFNDASTGFINPHYSWEFGDGGTSTEKNPSHQYTSYYPDQNFQARLTVTGDCGQTGAVTQIIPVTNSVLEFNVLGSISSWPLVQGTNTNSDLSMKIISNRPWKVSASDNFPEGKPAVTAGYLTEYDYILGTYPSSGKSLADRLHVIGENNVALSGTPAIIKDDSATLPAGATYPIGLSQVVSQSDYSLETNHGYRTVITFTASQDI